MRRFCIFAGLFIFMIFITTDCAFAGQEIAQFIIGSRNYLAAGNSYKMDVAPYLENNRTYLPVRYIAQALGIPEEKIVWDDETQSVYIKNENTEVKLTVNANIIWINDQPAVMDVSPEIRYNRTFLPARYVAEAFGGTVDWDQQNRIVYIYKTNITDQSSSYDSDTLKYEWKYKNDDWSWETKIDQNLVKQTLDYYETLPHPHRTQSDYIMTYCMEEADDKILESIARSFKEGAEREGYDQYDMVGMVIAFVQSITYVSDSESAGIDEYPRYPIETLLAREGDCEDTAILTAVLLRELGYGTALIFFDSHCAVGIKGDDELGGAYYLVEGTRYYYIETTDKGWNIGEIPEEYQDLEAIVLPLP